MESDSGRSRSIWLDTATIPSHPRLSRPVETQVCVVGGGIAGLTTAYLLAREGVRVTLVDKGQLGGGETGRTTAQLTCILDYTYNEIEQQRGREVARMAAESHTGAISLIARIASDEGIECDFQRMDGYIFPQPGDNGDMLSEELDAARRSGLSDVELVGHLPIPGFPAGPALRFPNQGHFHPLKYLAGLAKAVENHGGQIYGDTRVSKVTDGQITTVETEDGQTISADAVVLATHMPINDSLNFSSRVFPYRTYVIGLEVPRGSVPYALYFDTEDPYHYIRLQPTSEGDLLIVGGEDHKVGQADDMEARYARLESWTRERFPMAGPVRYSWSGQVLNTADGMGMFGISPGAANIYVITGQSGIGMTHSTIGARLVSDILRFRENPWAEAYDPARLPFSGLGEVVSEGLNTAAQAREWVSGSEVASEEQILPGKGAVLGWGPNKVAVYRDEQGLIHRRSALCTHLGCVVSWNDGEKSWDCPCHGSRFDPQGKVLHGPATEALGPAEHRN